MYTEAFSTPFLLKNPLNYRALLFRVVLHPLVCALFLEAVKHVLFKVRFVQNWRKQTHECLSRAYLFSLSLSLSSSQTATKTSRALFVLATETVFIRAVVDRLLVVCCQRFLPLALSVSQFDNPNLRDETQDMMEKIGNILLVQAVLSASRVAARVLIRDSETR